MTGMGKGAIMPVGGIATPVSGHLKLTGSLGKSASRSRTSLLTIPD
jgi:hypothetical protein